MMNKEILKKIKVVAFDCDGVMFDTINTNKVYYNSILMHFNMPEMTEDQLAYVHMHTAHESIRHLFKSSTCTKKALFYCKSLDYSQFFKYMEIEPFLKPLLKKLRSRYKTAIATNRTDTMGPILINHNIAEYFDIVVTAMDVKHPKPAPDPLIKILDHFNIKPENLIYIGDSKLDEAAALSAGVVFAAYRNHPLKADFHINNLKEFTEILDLQVTI